MGLLPSLTDSGVLQSLAVAERLRLAGVGESCTARTGERVAMLLHAPGVGGTRVTPMG